MVQYVVRLAEGVDLEGFRRGLRAAIGARISPENAVWEIGGQPSLFASGAMAGAAPVSIPRDSVRLIDCVVCHRDPQRYSLLYALVWRISRGERALLEMHSDPLVHRLNRMAKAVRRDIHKMHAFLRFRRVDGERDERFVAWFEPEHFILEAVADFFVTRYPSMQWSILTPDGSLHWDREHLTIGPPGHPGDAGAAGDVEAAWDMYFQSTFNPARVNRPQMLKEMSRKYWRNMPETKAIPDMLRLATSRVDQMIGAEARRAIKRDPQRALARMLDSNIKSLVALNDVIAKSEPFVKGGKRGVLGEGPMNPAIAFVGEQPGDQEDAQGRPFVGPAGQLLDRALHEAGIDRAKSYVTNAVKHFKFEERGKRRIHQKATTGEVKHYRWWLMKEMELVKPQLVIALGGTAALALTGKVVAIARSREPFDFDGQAGFITVHPSYLLRLPNEENRKQAYSSFVRDLVGARALVERGGLRRAG